MAQLEVIFSLSTGVDDRSYSDISPYRDITSKNHNQLVYGIFVYEITFESRATLITGPLLLLNCADKTIDSTVCDCMCEYVVKKINLNKFESNNFCR